jgi:hypothetical protein
MKPGSAQSFSTVTVIDTVDLGDQLVTNVANGRQFEFLFPLGIK